MRALLVLALAAGTAGYLAPGERDPTVYPWNRAPHAPVGAHGAVPPVAPWPLPAPQGRWDSAPGTYCVVALEPAGGNGIAAGGKPRIMGCEAPAPARPGAVAAFPPSPPSAEVAAQTRQIGPGIAWHVRAHKLSLVERVAQDCFAYVRGPALFRTFHAVLLGNGGARVRRAAWQSATPSERFHLIWDLAFHAECAARRPVLADVRILDERGRLLTSQRVSTAFECHGDFAAEYPGMIWYRC